MPGPVRSIGQVMKLLKPDFPDLSISKIRFLESEGLLSPERAPSGYRKYSRSDVDRLRYILTCQRDNFQPLKVIREHLAMIDRGEEPPAVDQPAPPGGVGSDVDEEHVDLNRPRGPIKLKRRELIRASGITEAQLVELERHQLVRTKRGQDWYGQEALMVCVASRRLRAFGMDTRHLRALRQAAEREAGMIEQTVLPHIRHQQEAGEIASQVTQLVLHAHAAMVYDLLEH
ncbi:MerR family transcriptional regulator [Acidipropionibacterium virtanenii]|uniref:Putative HTH-type transcriptional regulator n=1 Tax=Acidipropionibacterium virtanenii TaxID=2057246 RepID=A0A344UUF9_9ACTN|nr:MerR family transcriptional regulator [Acidipropionibacterium virtanenii]AXE38907.1 putative HTH-type transcriptional regulator [Acidipropionibacterium virtanenii]